MANLLYVAPCGKAKVWDSEPSRDPTAHRVLEVPWIRPPSDRTSRNLNGTPHRRTRIAFAVGHVVQLE